MGEEVVGTDVDCKWLLNAEGDLTLTEGSDNLSQAIYLRLTEYLNELDWCYTDYGSKLTDWFGKNSNEYTQETLLEEITKRVSLDPRITDVTVTLDEYTITYVGVHIEATVKDNENFSEYYIFTPTERTKNSKIYNPSFHDTHIQTRPNGYYTQQGELITVTATVLDEDDKKVPVGEVSVSIAGWTVDIENNPQIVAQSDSDNPGTVTFTFRVPLFIELGVHELVFNYSGLYGYNACTGSTDFNVVDYIPTTTTLQYNNYEYYYANDVDEFTDPITYTEDINNVPARLGTVEYYIDESHLVDDLLYVDNPLIFIDGVLLEERVVMYTVKNLREYTIRFMFNCNRIFYTKDIIELCDTDGTHIDNLICYSKDDYYFLVSTQKQYNCDCRMSVI